jgi:hypothetical protein
MPKIVREWKFWEHTPMYEQYLDEKKNSPAAVIAGFEAIMPASIIGVGRCNASFRLESDSIIGGHANLKFAGESEKGMRYILDCSGVYKCAIKADYLNDFLKNEIPAQLGVITLNDPTSGDRIDLLPGKLVRGVTLFEEQGPWGRMGAIITRQHLNIELIASKSRPVP